MENQGIKQVDALKALKPEKRNQELESIEGLFLKKIGNNEIENEKDEIKEGNKLKEKIENMKQKDPLVTFILSKLIQMKLNFIKAIC